MLDFDESIRLLFIDILAFKGQFHGFAHVQDIALAHYIPLLRRANDFCGNIAFENFASICENVAIGVISQLDFFVRSDSDALSTLFT